MKTNSHCIILKGEKKLYEKLRNDLLRLDRQNKESFLSQFLFCDGMPVYPLSAVKLVYFRENQEIVSDNVLVLREGLVKRKLKKGEGTELTSGCLVSCCKVA